MKSANYEGYIIIAYCGITIIVIGAIFQRQLLRIAGLIFVLIGLVGFGKRLYIRIRDKVRSKAT